MEGARHFLFRYSDQPCRCQSQKVTAKERRKMKKKKKKKKLICVGSQLFDFYYYYFYFISSFFLCHQSSGPDHFRFCVSATRGSLEAKHEAADVSRLSCQRRPPGHRGALAN